MFEKAIKIILSEPPELHYPSYYADLLREKSSEIPNSSDTISRQDAIDALRKLREEDIKDYGSEIPEGFNQDHLDRATFAIKQLPSAEPEVSLMTVKVIPDLEEMERVARKIKDTPVTVLPSDEPEIIRCKDCKHRPITNDNYDADECGCGFNIEFPDYKCPCQCTGDNYYNWLPDDNWFCGNAERKNE